MTQIANPLRLLRPFALGVREGFAQPWDLGMGMTYDDDPRSPRSRAYDHGANVGQALGRGPRVAWRRWRFPDTPGLECPAPTGRFRADRSAHFFACEGDVRARDRPMLPNAVEAAVCEECGKPYRVQRVGPAEDGSLILIQA